MKSIKTASLTLILVEQKTPQTTTINSTRKYSFFTRTDSDIKILFYANFFFIFLKCFWLFNLKRFLRNPKLHWYNLRLSRYFLHFASSYTLLFKTLTNMLCVSYYVNIIFWVGIWSVIKVCRKKIWKELILTWRFSAIVSLDSANLNKFRAPILDMELIGY